MAKSHKAQHWIPKLYLRAGVEPDTPPEHEPFVHVYSRDGKQHSYQHPPTSMTKWISTPSSSPTEFAIFA